MSHPGAVAHGGRADDTEGLQPLSLVQLATDTLRRDILSGALEPGERLVEEQLTARFQISRAPLREALRLLAEQGLVEHVPRRGARVTTYSQTDFDELFAVRNALERFAATLLTDRDPGQLDTRQVEEALDLLGRAVDDGDRIGANNAHRAFHLALVATAGNRQLVLTYEPILVKLQLYMAANLRREAEHSSPHEGVRRHARLLDAVRSGQRERIDEELANHGARRFFH